MARLSTLLTVCASISLSLGAAFEPMKAVHVGRHHRVMARQDDIPVAVPAETLSSTAATVTTPPEIPLPGVAIAAVEPTAPGQIGVNPPTTPKIELHTSFTDQPMTVTVSGAPTPTVAAALVTATVANGYLNIGLAPKLGDKLAEIAKQIPPCGGAVVKRLASTAVKIKGRQTAPLCGLDGFASRVSQETGLVDWELLGAQIKQAVTEAMGWEGIDIKFIQLIGGPGVRAAWALAVNNPELALGGMMATQVLKGLYESFHLHAGSAGMKGVAFDTKGMAPSQTEYKTDGKTCKAEEKDRPKCKANECKGDENDFCTTGDQSGCPCQTPKVKEIGQMRPPAWDQAFSKLPPLFGKQNVVTPPQCDTTARFNFPLDDWKAMAFKFANGQAKGLDKEAMTAFNGTYKFTFGWAPNADAATNAGSKCRQASVNSMLDYMVDEPARGCREGSVDNTLFGSGKMETDCGTVRWSIKMPDGTVFVDPVINDPSTGLDTSPRFCYDKNVQPWTGQTVVKQTLEEQAKIACEKFLKAGDHFFTGKEAVRLHPVSPAAGFGPIEQHGGVTYGFRLDWNRGREGCSAEELAKIPGGTSQPILPVEGDGSCSALMVQAWEKCDKQYGGNMGGYYDVGCLQYSFRPYAPDPRSEVQGLALPGDQN